MYLGTKTHVVIASVGDELKLVPRSESPIGTPVTLEYMTPSHCYVCFGEDMYLDFELYASNAGNVFTVVNGNQLAYEGRVLSAKTHKDQSVTPTLFGNNPKTPLVLMDV